MQKLLQWVRSSIAVWVYSGIVWGAISCASPSVPPAPTGTPTPPPAITQPALSAPTQVENPATVAPTRLPAPVATSKLTAAPDTADWVQLAHDAQRTGFVPADINGPKSVKWIWNGPAGSGEGGPGSDHLQLPKGVQPITGDGKIYIGHSDGVARAISEATGKLVWLARLEAGIPNAGAFDLETKSVYFGTLGGRFWRVDAATGNVMVSNRPGGQVLTAPLLVGDTVYVGTTTGVLYAFDKVTLSQKWSYATNAAIIASLAYAENFGGLIIALAEDKTVHAVQATDGAFRWRVTVNADSDPKRGDAYFADTYPVVSDANGVVIVRSYLRWEKMWKPATTPTSIADLRTYLTQNPGYQSFFVLNLADGSPRFVAPVLVGAIGNGGDFESVSPQAIVKRLADGRQVAYLLWRNGQACDPTRPCDPREDTTLGEMDLASGAIRFVQDYKNQGTMRMPTDEQSPLAMAGNSLFYAHWGQLGGLRIADRSPNLGGSYRDPIRTTELMPVFNTLAAGTCPARTNHFCPMNMADPGGVFSDPGLYVYYSNKPAYDLFWSTPIRSAIIANNTIYWKTTDGAIVALSP